MTTDRPAPAASDPPTTDAPPRNVLLAALPEEERARLLPQLERVELVPMGVIADIGEPIPHVHFPESGVISLRMDAGAFLALLPSLPTLDLLVRRYVVYLMAQVSQSLACNGVHALQQRCARWMLMTHDRVPGDEFVITHEVLSQMLAVRRAGVSEAAGALQDAGLIRYSRGRMRVVDREGLERAACECYGIVRAHRERLLPPVA